MKTPLWFGLGAVVLRLLLAGVFLLVQVSSPGEGGMVVLFDLPTLGVLFLVSSIIQWPEGVTDAYDLPFLGFGLVTWFVIGLVIGIASQWITRRSSASHTDM